MFAAFFRLSVSKQFFLMLMVGIVVQVAVLQLFTRQPLLTSQIDDKIASIREIFVVTHDAVEYLMLDGRIEEALKLMAILNTTPEVNIAFVSDTKGDIQVSTNSKYRKQNVQQVIDDYQLAQFSDMLIHTDDHKNSLSQKLCENGEKLVFVAPIRFSHLGLNKGHETDFVLFADLKDTRKLLLWSSYKAFAIQIGAMVLISLLMILLFHKGIQSRLLHIIDALKHSAEGHSHAPTLAGANDEIAHISRESNRLIVQLKSSRTEIERQKDYFQSVFDNIAHIAVIVDPKGNIVRCNHMAKTHLENLDEHVTEKKNFRTSDIEMRDIPFSTRFPISGSRDTSTLFQPDKQDRELSFKSFLQVNDDWRRVDVKMTHLSSVASLEQQNIILIVDEHLQYQLQSQLAEKEHKLSSILENVPGLVFVLENDNGLQFINHKARRFFCLDDKPYSVSEFMSLLPDALREHILARHRKVEIGEVFKREGVCFHDSEGEHTFSITLFPVSIHAASGSYTACVMLDVTKDVQNERKLIASQQHLKEFASYSPVAIIEWNYHFEVTFWNSAAESVFAISAEHAVGQTLPKLIANNTNIEALSRHLEQTRNQQKSYTREISYQRRNSSRKYTEWSSFAIPVESLNEPRFASMVVDVTQITDMINDLILKEAEKDELLAFLLEPVITIDQKGVILTFNRAAEQVFGYSSAEIKGQNVKKLMPEDMAKAHDGYLKRHMVTGQKSIIGTGREVVGLRRNGEQFPMHLSVSELPQKPGELRRFIGNCIDLSDLKDKERQLSRSMKMEALGKLTGGIAHDFNNLLGIMMGYCELVMIDAELSQRHHESLQEIRKAGERATGLTSKLLNFSKKRPQQISSVNLTEVITENRLILEKSLRPGINLCFKLQEVKPTNIDVNDFEDALLNLVINSVQALQNRGEINVKTYDVGGAYEHGTDSTEDYVICEVSDNGPGIPAECLDKVFDPFFSTKGEKGTGLGLSQVYGFAKRSNGRVEVESSPQGTTFQLVLPVYDGRKKCLPKTEMQNQFEDKYAGRILVVDDEENLTDILRLILEKAGFTVATCNSASDALKVLAERKFDLLLTDVIMPEMDGIMLSSEARAISPSTRILMMSGYMDYQKSSDMDDELYRKLIKKPFAPADVVEAVAAELK